MPHKLTVTNPHFPEVRKKIWFEEEAYKFLLEKNLLQIGENEKLIILEAWNRGIEHMLFLQSDTPKVQDDNSNITKQKTESVK